jgi:hypothetical protein
VTFITFGAINQSIFNDLHQQCPGGHCSPDRSGDVDKGRRAQTIANVGFGVGVAGAALGCILLVSGAETAHKPEEAVRRPGNVSITDFAISPHAVEVQGVF